MPFCLLPSKVADFRKALKDGDLSLERLLDPALTSAARTKLFEEYAGPENAADINRVFEEKLVLKNRILGIRNAFEKLGELGKYDAKARAATEAAVSEYKATQTRRIFSPKENEAFLNDLADKRAGVHISKEVAAAIFEKTSNLATLKEKGGTFGVSNDYLNAKKDLDAYLKSQEPVSASRSVIKNLAVIARNNLLLNPSTPLKTGIGQIVNSVMDVASRRIGALSLRGENPDLASELNKEAWQTFRKTGYNVASMESLDDTHKLGKGEDFSTPNATRDEGLIEKGIRKTAQVSNKVTIDWEHNYAYTKFYQKTFYDSANIAASKLAEAEQLTGAAAKTRSAEVMRDAAKVVPGTREGAMVRAEAQYQAARITSTNETWLSRASLGFKRALNATGIPLGDLIEPIAKIPANIIANGIDNAGAGIPKGLRDVFQGRAKLQSEDIQTRYEGSVQFAAGLQHLARIGGTLGLAAFVASQIPVQNFRKDTYGNQFIRIGNVWINAEYFTAISPALGGMLSIKANGSANVGKDALEYVGGVGTSLLHTPGIEEGPKAAQAVANAGSLDTGLVNYGKDFFSSRGVPVFFKNLVQGKFQNLFVGSNGLQTDAQYQAQQKEKKAASAAKAKATKAKKK